MAFHAVCSRHCVCWRRASAKGLPWHSKASCQTLTLDKGDCLGLMLQCCTWLLKYICVCVYILKILLIYLRDGGEQRKRDKQTLH